MFPFFQKKPPIDELWQWFKANRQRLEGETGDSNAYKQLSRMLKEIDRSLTYEIVRDGDMHEIQISSDGIPELISLVKEIVGKSPDIRGWNVVAFRQAHDHPVEIDVYDQVLTAENVRFAIDAAKPEAVDITIYVPGLTEENYRHLAHCAVMIMESIIGEYHLMTKLDEIEYEAAGEDNERETLPLTDLPRVIRSIGVD